MQSSAILPDQLNTWSDNYTPQDAQTSLVRFAKAATAALAPAAPARSLAPRLPHRTLQTLRQSGMQMRPRARSWTQVLPLRKLSRTTPANGLRPPGFSAAGHRISRSLPPAPQNCRGDLPDQSRTPAPARGLVSDDDARPKSTDRRSARYTYGGYPSGQYARRLAKTRAQSVTLRTRGLQ